MRITILVENSTSRTHNKVCASEWGFSAHIQTQERTILFDTGHSDIYWNNAKNLDIDLNKVGIIGLSHRHWDHVKGLLHHDFKNKKKIIMHPVTQQKAPNDVIAIMNSEFEIETSVKPFEFSSGCYFLGEIPRKVSYEKGEYKGEQMLDDTAIAIKTRNGTVVVTGCSHSGISNICEHAKEVTGQRLFAVIGGFHLFEHDNEAVKGALRYFQKEQPQHLYPMHCVDFPTLIQFHTLFNIQKLGVGDVIEFDD